jgi:hypothetical protein
MTARSLIRPLTGLLAGLLAGWLFSSFREPRAPGENANRHGASTIPFPVGSAGQDSEQSPRLRIADEKVWVPAEDLQRLTTETLAARMHMDDSAANGWSCVAAMSSWVPMTQEEMRLLSAALDQAARARRDWEESHVKVAETGPGEWTVFFPGDGAMARQNLHASIEEIFGAERARQIEILGNPDAFFGMKWLAPGFRHGQIRVRAMMEPSLFSEARVRLSVEIDGKAIGLHLDGESLQEQAFASRILKHLGGPDAVREGAMRR